MRIVKGAIVGVGVVAALGASVPGFAGGNKYDAINDSRDCGDGDAVNWVGPIKLWPPNHKFVPVSITSDGGTDGENVSITVTPVVTDAVGGDGGPNHDPDYTPGGSPTASGTDTATVDLALRSERSGRGDGRIYTINWVATFDNGAKTCDSDDEGQSPFVVDVPHDMRDKHNES